MAWKLNLRNGLPCLKQPLKTMKARPENVDEYMDAHPAEVKGKLEVMRRLIRSTVPAAVEGIAYGMPSYKLDGKPLAYFAGYARHVGLYATPSCHEAFSHELAAYRTGKGSVQFPIDTPLPEALISRMVAYRADSIRCAKQKASKGSQPKG
jgi:uncharacterized protein YdhG (YjbR/CyaY superfamily)